MATVLPAIGGPLHSTLTRGNIDSNRTSTVSLAYKPRTMPTPWPFLLLSFFLDLVTAFWSAGGWGVAPFCLQKIEEYMGYIETRMLRRHRIDRDLRVSLEQRPNWSKSSTWRRFKRCFEGLGLCISVLRSSAAFALALMATWNDKSRFLSASAVAGLLFSSIPYWCGQMYAGYHHGVLRVAALIASYMAFITHFIMFAYYHDHSLNAGNYETEIGNHDTYGNWFLTGGNCPLDVKDRELVESLSLIGKLAVGCGVETAIKPEHVRKSPGSTDANIIKSVEMWPNFVVLMCVGFVFALLFLCFAPIAIFNIYFGFGKTCYWIKNKLLGRETKTAEDERTPLLEEDSDGENLDVFDGEHAEFRTTSFRVPKEAVDLAMGKTCLSFSKFAAITILLLAAISVPTHYVQETHPRTITVIDNYGPLVELTNTTSSNITSWTDYFNIRAPSYDIELRQRWWRENDCKLCFIMAMV